MHVIVRGTLIGGAVGAVLAVVRGRGKGDGEPEPSAAGRYAKSIAEGAVAGAAVGFVLDRRLRSGAVALAAEVADRAPGLVETVTDTIVEVAVPRVVELAEQAYGAARPRVLELAELARERAADLRAS